MMHPNARHVSMIGHSYMHAPTSNFNFAPPEAFLHGILVNRYIRHDRSLRSDSLAPVQILQTAFTRYLSSSAAHEGLAYGSNSGPLETREAIAEWLGRVDPGGSNPTSHNILITGGASLGLNQVMQKFTCPGFTRRVFMIAPTYYLAADVFKDCGFWDRITGIPEDSQGLDLPILVDHLEKFDAQEEIMAPPEWQKRTYRYVFYGVPTFSNPTGSIMSHSRRLELVELARKFDMLLITDDVYDQLNYTTDRIPPKLVNIDAVSSDGDGFGNTVSNCSFSKLLAPGLRFGFIQSSKALITELSTHGATKSGGCPSQFTSSCLANVIADGTLDKRIAYLQKVYSARAHAYMSAIDKYWGIYGITYKPCRGGIFFWIQLPEGLKSSEVCAAAAKEGVLLMGGTRCKVPEDASLCYEDYIRVCIAFEKEDEAVEGIRMLGEVFKRLHILKEEN